MTTEFAIAIAGKQDKWVPANGGTETPFKSRSGIRMLYCYNPALGRHEYLNVDTDIIMTDSEVRAAISPERRQSGGKYEEPTKWESRQSP